MKAAAQAVKWTRVILGFICGVVATGPMTAAMVLWHRRLPESEKYPPPPREITGAVMEKAGVSATAEQLSAATPVTYFAYGGAAGGFYGLIPPAKVGKPVRSGFVLGSSLSYLGLLPATEHQARRSGLMPGAHFLWGLSLCTLHQLLLSDARRGAPALEQRGRPNADRAD